MFLTINLGEGSMEETSAKTVYTEENVYDMYGKEERKGKDVKTRIDEENVKEIKLFEKIKNEEPTVGRPYYLDYEKANVLITDKWKNRVGGIPQGTFLLAFYEEEEEFTEALLLRVIKPTRLPSEEEVIGAIIDYYKDNKETTGSKSEIDVVTKSELSYSGLECRVLGTFYKEDNKLIFGSDVENFYSAYHYKVYKLKGEALEYVVNQNVRDFKIGTVRYSSSRRFQNKEKKVPVYIDPEDFLGKRTALFGMTRTGKSNTVKKILEATVKISKQYENLEDGTEKPVGQIIFDMNGEYANPNKQDKGAIKETIEKMYGEDMVDIWGTYQPKGKPYVKLMKTNFYFDIQGGFDHIKRELEGVGGNYVKNFLSIDLTEPEDYKKPIKDKSHDKKNETFIYDRKKAIYQCCLKAAGFSLPSTLNKIKFFGDKIFNDDISTTIKPHKWVTLDEAKEWFTELFKFSGTDMGKTALEKFENEKGYKFIDSDIETMLIFLTQKKNSTARPNLDGFLYLQSLRDLHSPDSKEGFEKDIVNNLRDGKIQIVDLSIGNPEVQKKYSVKICEEIFKDSISRFIKNETTNFIQFYFEEAHNLFPKKQDKDLNQIYNRIAKEGAKLKLGLIYATQEASSISSNILKNTQNWFVSHLNNTDETKEIEKYYDFSDFITNLRKFSPQKDTGFIRMKVHSNPFVVPVQIDEFKANSNDDVLED